MFLKPTEVERILKLVPIRLGHFYSILNYKPYDITDYTCECGCHQDYVFYNECPQCHQAIKLPKNVRWKKGNLTNLAEESYTSYPSLHLIFTGEMGCRDKTFDNICHALDVTREELLDD